MSSEVRISPFKKNTPNEGTLQVFSFLDPKSLQTVECVSKGFKHFADNFQIWQRQTEINFGKIIAQRAKCPNISWKQTYDVLTAHTKKITTDDTQYRTSGAAATLLGLPMPNPSTHYYPTGQTGQLGRFQITVMKSTQ